MIKLSDELKIDISLLNRTRPKLHSALNDNLLHKMREKSFFTNVIISFVIYLSTFLVFYYIHKKTLNFNSENFIFSIKWEINSSAYFIEY